MNTPSPGNRPVNDLFMFFNVLTIHRIHNLLEEAAEFQIPDRINFNLFLEVEP